MIDSDRLFIVLLCALALMGQPLFAKAAMPSGVYISEVGWAGSSKSQADEWLELANATDEPVDVSLWAIEGAGTSGSTLTIPNGSVIEPYTIFLIANYDAAHEKSTLATVPDYSTTALSLSNSTFKLTLRNAAGVAVDEVGDGGKPSAGGIKENGGAASMVRTADGWEAATLSIGFDEGSTDLGTPGMLDVFEEEELEQTTETASAEETAQTESNETESSSSETDNADRVEKTPSESSAAETNPDEEPASESSSAPIIYPSGTLVIRDWLENPPKGESEWVEIFNPYNNVIPLDGWKIREGGGRRVSLPDQLLGFEQSVRVTFSGSALNNDGDTIELLDPSGAVIDEVTYEPETKTASEVEQETSVAQTTSDVGEEAPLAEPRQNDSVGLAVEQKTSGEDESSIVSFAGLRLSEIYPNTDGPDAEYEFVELENVGENAIDLFNVALEDAAGSRWSIDEHLTIKPGEHIAFFRSAFGFALNNTGQETVRLFSPAGELLDEITYENSPQGFTIARIDDAWSWTATPTPNEPNQLSSPPSAASDGAAGSVAGASQTKSAVAITIEEVREEPRGSAVRVVGVVTASPGTFGNQVMYLSGTGIQIYKHDGEWPELAVGDLVEVTGTVSSNRGEARIKIGKKDSLEVLESGEAVEPVRVTALSEENEGRLVIVQGLVRKVQKDRIELEVDGVEMTVRIKDGADINTEDIAAGDLVEVTGIVSQTDGRYYLLPRSMDDIRVINMPLSEPTASPGKEMHEGQNTLRGLALGLATLIFLTALYVRHRRRHRRASGGTPGRLPEPAPTRI